MAFEVIMYRKVAFLVSMLVLLGEQPVSSAAPLVCPVKSIAADPAQVAQITSVIPAGDALDDVAKLNAIVSTLRTMGIGSAIIIDNLISAYCPVVAANAALNDQQKTAQMRRFASKIVRIVYGLDSGDDIILDVPFKPDVMNAINSRATAERLAPEDWVANAVGSYLKGAR
jgi:hypothetical protein